MSVEQQKLLQEKIYEELSYWYKNYWDGPHVLRGLCLRPFFSTETSWRSEQESVTTSKISWAFFLLYPNRCSRTKETFKTLTTFICMIQWTWSSDAPGDSSDPKLQFPKIKKQEDMEFKGLQALAKRIQEYAVQWVKLSNQPEAQSAVESMFCLTQAMFQSAPTMPFFGREAKSPIFGNTKLMSSRAEYPKRRLEARIQNSWDTFSAFFNVRVRSGFLFLGRISFMENHLTDQILHAFLESFEESGQSLSLVGGMPCAKEVPIWPRKDEERFAARRYNLAKFYSVERIGDLLDKKGCTDIFISEARCYTFSSEKTRALTGWQINCRMIGRKKEWSCGRRVWKKDIQIDVKNRRFMMKGLPVFEYASLKMAVLAHLCVELRDLFGNNFFSEYQEHEGAVNSYEKYHSVVGMTLWNCLKEAKLKQALTQQREEDQPSGEAFNQFSGLLQQFITSVYTSRDFFEQGVATCVGANRKRYPFYPGSIPFIYKK